MKSNGLALIKVVVGGFKTSNVVITTGSLLSISVQSAVAAQKDVQCRQQYFVMKQQKQNRKHLNIPLLNILMILRDIWPSLL